MRVRRGRGTAGHTTAHQVHDNACTGFGLTLAAPRRSPLCRGSYHGEPRPMALAATAGTAHGALISFGILLIAAVLALLLAAQERALRHRRIGPWLRVLPPLTLTETLLFRLIGAGFILLTLTLLTGALFVDNLFGQHLAHKTILSIVAWLVFGVLLYGRWKHGWRGLRAVNLTLIGMAVLLLAFFGTKAVLELILHRQT